MPIDSSLFNLLSETGADAVVTLHLKGASVVSSEIHLVGSEFGRLGRQAEKAGAEAAAAGTQAAAGVEKVGNSLGRASKKALTFRESFRQALSPAAIGATAGKALVSGIAITAFFGTIIGVINTVRSGIQNIIALFREATNTVSNYQQATLGLQALLASTFTFSKDLAENFKVAGIIADKMQRELIRRNRESIASFEDLQLSLQAAMGAGLPKYVKNWKEAVQVVILLSNAIAATTVGQQQSRQLTQEMRDFQQGNLRTTAQLSRLIDQLVKGGLKNQLAKWAETKTMAEDLAKLLPGFATATFRFGRTLEGVKTTFKSIWQLIQIEVFGPVFEMIANELSGLAEKLQSPNGPLGQSIARMTKLLSTGLIAGFENFLKVISNNKTLEDVFEDFEDSVERLAYKLPALGAAAGKIALTLVDAFLAIIRLLSSGQLFTAVIKYMATTIRLVAGEVVAQIGRDMVAAIRNVIRELATTNPLEHMKEPSTLLGILVPPVNYFQRMRAIYDDFIKAAHAEPLKGKALDKMIAQLYPQIKPSDVDQATRDWVSKYGTVISTVYSSIGKALNVPDLSAAGAIDTLEDSVSLWDKIGKITEEYTKEVLAIAKLAGVDWTDMYNGVEQANATMVKFMNRMDNLIRAQQVRAIRAVSKGHEDQYFVTPKVMMGAPLLAEDIDLATGQIKESSFAMRRAMGGALPPIITDIETMNEGMARFLDLLVEAKDAGIKIPVEKIASYVRELQKEAELVHIRKMTEERERVMKTYDTELELRESQAKKDLAHSNALLAGYDLQISGLRRALSIDEQITLEREKQVRVTNEWVLTAIRAGVVDEDRAGIEQWRTREMERQLSLYQQQLRLDEELRRARQIVRRFRLQQEGVIAPGVDTIGINQLLDLYDELDAKRSIRLQADDAEQLATTLASVRSELVGIIEGTTSFTTLLRTAIIQAYINWLRRQRETKRSQEALNKSLQQGTKVIAEQTVTNVAKQEIDVKSTTTEIVKKQIDVEKPEAQLDLKVPEVKPLKATLDIQIPKLEPVKLELEPQIPEIAPLHAQLILDMPSVKLKDVDQEAKITPTVSAMELPDTELKLVMPEDLPTSLALDLEFNIPDIKLKAAELKVIPKVPRIVLPPAELIVKVKLIWPEGKEPTDREDEQQFTTVAASVKPIAPMLNTQMAMQDLVGFDSEVRSILTNLQKDSASITILPNLDEEARINEIALAKFMSNISVPLADLQELFNINIVPLSADDLLTPSFERDMTQRLQIMAAMSREAEHLGTTIGKVPDAMSAWKDVKFIFKDIKDILTEQKDLLYYAFGQGVANAIQAAITGQGSFRAAIGSMVIAIGNLICSIGAAQAAMGVLTRNPAQIIAGVATMAAGAAVIALGHAMGGGGPTSGNLNAPSTEQETVSFSFNQAQIAAQQGMIQATNNLAAATNNLNTMPAGIVVRTGGREMGGFLPVVAKESSSGANAQANVQLARSLAGRP